MNTDLLTLVLNEISCCQYGHCCEILLATGFLGITLLSLPSSLWTCLIFQAWVLLPQCRHLITIFDTICAARTALFYLGKSVVVCLSGRLIRLKDTNGSWLLRSPVTPAPLDPVCLPERKRIHICWTARHNQEIISSYMGYPLVFFFCTPFRLKWEKKSLLWWD